MLGFDFYNFWNTGRAVLAGNGPYSVVDSFYPPAMAYLYTILALLPFNFSFGLWTGLNLILFQKSVQRFQKGWQGIAWLAFAPVTFIFLTGQIDILFLWLAGFLGSKGWKAILAGVLVTLKPQIAFIVMPWFLLQWILHERTKVVWWAAGAVILHTLPLLLDPLIYQKWLAAAGGESSWRLAASPGVFSLTNLDIPLVVIGILAAAIVGLGLVMLHNVMFSRTAQLLALPGGLWYENVFLIGSTPWWLLVPISWAMFFVANQIHHNYPFVLIPLASFVWQYFHKSEKVAQPQALPGQA
jgi:hypothetical protein